MHMLRVEDRALTVVHALCAMDFITNRLGAKRDSRAPQTADAYGAYIGVAPYDSFRVRTVC